MQPRSLACSGLVCFAVASGVGSGAPALAQQLQPRCGGWPPVAGKFGRTGMMVGQPGVPCYGALNTRVRDECALLSARVAVPPRQGRFQLIGLTNFEYVPNASTKGIDRIEVALDWNCASRRSSNRIVMHATTQGEYAAAGGTSSAPPRGYGYDSR